MSLRYIDNDDGDDDDDDDACVCACARACAHMCEGEKERCHDKDMGEGLVSYWCITLWVYLRVQKRGMYSISARRFLPPTPAPPPSVSY